MASRDVDEHGYLRQLLENSPDGVFTIDTELKIHYVNAAFCRLLGYPPEKLIGSSITEHLGDLDILGACMVSIQESGHCNDQETIFKRSDGAMVHISKNVQAIYDGSGGVREILVTIRDLTELHALNRKLELSLQEQERANHELEETLDTLRATQDQLVQSKKMAALGSLVAGMSHEINTPIGISVTSASTIQEDTLHIANAFEKGQMKRSDLEQYLQHTLQASDIMLTNLRRASDLIRSFKQVAVDQSSGDWRSVNLKTYIDEILLSLRPKLKSSHVEVENACDPDLVLVTNPGAIYQIISNLVLNAIDHAFVDGEAGRLTIQAQPMGSGIQISVSDNGKGIAPDHIERVFDPFFTTRRGQGGSGLGLNILYNLITSTLKGDVRVQSALGEGTTFYLDIPATGEQGT